MQLLTSFKKYHAGKRCEIPVHDVVSCKVCHPLRYLLNEGQLIGRADCPRRIVCDGRFFQKLTERAELAVLEDQLGRMQECALAEASATMYYVVHESC